MLSEMLSKPISQGPSFNDQGGAAPLITAAFRLSSDGRRRLKEFNASAAVLSVQVPHSEPNPQPRPFPCNRAYLVTSPITCECQRPLAGVRFCSMPAAQRSSKAFPPVALGDQQQHFHRDLPVGGIVLGFWQRGDVFGDVAQRQQRAAVRHHDGVKEPLRCARIRPRAAGLRCSEPQ